MFSMASPAATELASVKVPGELGTGKRGPSSVATLEVPPGAENRRYWSVI
jgi:hypothetical protein